MKILLSHKNLRSNVFVFKNQDLIFISQGITKIFIYTYAKCDPVLSYLKQNKFLKSFGGNLIVQNIKRPRFVIAYPFQKQTTRFSIKHISP